jgi:hypothetical protein
VFHVKGESACRIVEEKIPRAALLKGSIWVISYIEIITNMDSKEIEKLRNKTPKGLGSVRPVFFCTLRNHFKNNKIPF